MRQCSHAVALELRREPERLTHYRNYEPLIVDNDSADQATIEYQDPYSRNTTGCSRPTISSRDKAL